MTSGHALAVVAILQGLLLAALLLLIAFNRWLRGRRRARVHPLHVALDQAMRAWALGTGSLRVVLEALARLPTAVAVEALVGWASRVPAERWQDLATTLADAPWARAVRADAQSGRWWKRLETARYLSVAAVPADTPYLTRLLRDPHPAVHLAVAGSLERVLTPTLVSAALERLPQLTPTVYAYYASMLQKARALVSQRLIEYLRRATDPDLGRYAEFAARLEEPILRAPLTALATHPDAEVRVQVARGLGAFPHTDTVATLRALATDPGWPVRAQAARALGRLADAGSLTLLRTALEDEEWWVRMRAALALMRLGASGRNALLEAEVGANPLARDMARLALGLSPQALAESAA